MKRKKDKTPKQLVFSGLNKIYTTSRDLAKEWEQSTIPLLTLESLVDKSKLPVEGDAIEFREWYNNLLDTLFTTCKDKAVEMNTTNVSTKYLKICIEHIKKTMATWT